MTAEDKRAIACNLTEATSTASRNALAYLQWPNPGWGNERVALLIRSRGGRWIEKWEDMRRLGNFRFKTIPPEHPLYGRINGQTDATLDQVRAACDRLNGADVRSGK